VLLELGAGERRGERAIEIILEEEAEPPEPALEVNVIAVDAVTGRSIDGAEVSVARAETGEAIAPIAGTRERFRLPAGRYDIAASRKGYVDTVVTWTIDLEESELDGRASRPHVRSPGARIMKEIV